jgi:hypothetical protein
MAIRRMRANVKSRSDRRNQSGTAIVAALVVVTVVSVLSMAYLQLSMSKNREQRSSVDAKRAFYIAEAGLAEAYAGLVAGKSGNVGNGTIPARFANGAFWVESVDEGDGRRTLTSTGMCGTGRSALSIVVENVPEPVGALGVFGDQGLFVGEGVLIDGYDSRRGTYESQHPVGGAGGGGLLVIGGGGLLGGGGGLVGSEGPAESRVGCNADIVLPGGVVATHIDGDAQPGPGSSVLRGLGVTITGTTAPRTKAAELPALDVPSLPLAGDIDHSTVRTPLVLSPQESSFGALRVRAGATAVIVGPAKLVFGSLQLDPSATLTIDATNGRVDVYVSDYLNMAAGSTYSSTSHDPTGISLLIAANQSIDRDRDGIPEPPARIQSTGSFYGSVYAPAAALTFQSQLEVFGAVAAQQLTIGNGAKLHFDRALCAPQNGDGALPQMLCWRLVELPDVPLVQMRLDPLSVMEMNGITPAESKDAHYDNGDDPLAGVVGVVLRVIKGSK